MIDVRTQAEWDAGHIENATFMDSLQTILRTTPNAAMNDTLRELGLWGCQNCRTVVYCRSGARASVALDLLERVAGFQGPLNNGQGVGQWQNAGYKLVTTESTSPKCTVAADTEELTCARSGASEGALEEEGGGTSTTPEGGGAVETTPPTLAPSADDTVVNAIIDKKDAPATKCGSLANQLNAGLGGSAAQAKDCSRNGNGGRRRRRLRGM